MLGTRLVIESPHDIDNQTAYPGDHRKQFRISSPTDMHALGFKWIEKLKKVNGRNTNR